MRSTRSASLLRNFFDEAEQIFALYDKNLNLIDVNRAGLEIYHFRRNTVIGKNIAEIFPGIRETGRLAIYKKVIRTGNPVLLDDVLSDRSLGGQRLRIKAFKVGEGLGIAATDITDLKKTIEELDNFVYRSSHDLRSPLASISGLLEIAKIEMREAPAAWNYFETIKGQVVRLEKLLQKILDSAKTKQDKLTIGRIDFRKMIDEVIASLAQVKGFRDIAFSSRVSVAGKFYSDSTLLTSILQNLIENAIKYKMENRSDSYVKVSVVDEKEGVKITVRDNGIGIPGKMHRHVFKMFRRATDKAKGTGIGLNTVKNCVKKLGGEISLRSKKGAGTTFTVYLPDAGSKRNG